MKKKIIITGGLGYIGTELCKLYSGVSWHHQVIVIDNRFISERVSQIRNWNIEFIHGDILNKDLIRKYCEDADVVHHLAGITSVPRTKNEASVEQDKKIKEVGEKGTQNILDVIKDKCKIIALISDQNPVIDENTKWLSFFGHSVPVIDGPEKIAKKFNYPVLFCDIQKENNGFYNITFETLEENPKESTNGEITKKFFKRLEKQIKEDPNNYLWSHNRWKHKK